MRVYESSKARPEPVKLIPDLLELSHEGEGSFAVEGRGASLQRFQTAAKVRQLRQAAIH